MTPRYVLAAATLACGIAAAPAQATLILQTGLAGGSGDVSNVLFNSCGLGGGSGTTVQGCLPDNNNSGDDVLVNFTSTESLFIQGGGQAAIRASDGAFDNFVITLGDATLGFAKLQFNLNAAQDGTATFRGVDQFGEVFTFTEALSGNGNNQFTLTAIDGQIATSFSLMSTAPISGITDLQQVRIGTAELVAVPVPASLALFGAGLVGLGLVRRRTQA